MFSIPEHYELYDDVNFLWKSDLTGFSMVAPWIDLEVEVPVEQAANLLETSKIIQSKQTISPESKNAFLAHFREYPVLRILPRNHPQTPVSSVDSVVLDADLPLRLANQISTTEYANISVPENWRWNTDKILKQSKIHSMNLYDPLSVYTLIRELRLKDQYSGDADRRLIDRLRILKAKNEKKFFSAIIQSLFQTFHVTLNCQNALKPALAFPSICALVAEFMNAEQGHHHLVMDTLRSLGAQTPNQDDIFSETKLCMEILLYSAKHSPLAFSCLVGAFEGNDYADTDPIATLIFESSHPNAAVGIQKHFLINKEGNHAAIGETFIRKLAPATQETVILTVCLAELLSQCQTALSAKLLKMAEFES